MKVAIILATAASVIGARAVVQQSEERKLMSYTVVFDECQGMLLDDCLEAIKKDIEEQPDLFEGRTFEDFKISEGHVRDDDHASNYYKIGLRTNPAETHVAGVLGDGMIWYKFPWCVTDDDCYTIGPWDCDVGTPLTVDECCDMIKASVPDPDKNGNYVDCVESHPVGSVHNPVDYSRILIHTDHNGVVVGEPRNE